MANNMFQRPVTLRNLAEHKHQAAAVRHVPGSEHSRLLVERATPEFLQSLAADRYAAKLAAEKRRG